MNKEEIILKILEEFELSSIEDVEEFDLQRDVFGLFGIQTIWIDDYRNVIIEYKDSIKSKQDLIYTLCEILDLAPIFVQELEYLYDGRYSGRNEQYYLTEDDDLYCDSNTCSDFCDPDKVITEFIKQHPTRLRDQLTKADLSNINMLDPELSKVLSNTYKVLQNNPSAKIKFINNEDCDIDAVLLIKFLDSRKGRDYHRELWLAFSLTKFRYVIIDEHESFWQGSADYDCDIVAELDKYIDYKEYVDYYEERRLL